MGLGVFFWGAKPKKAIPWWRDRLSVLFLGLEFRDLGQAFMVKVLGLGF